MCSLILLRIGRVEIQIEIRKGRCTADIRIVKSNVSSVALRQREPTLETLDYTIRIGSTPTLLYFDLYKYIFAYVYTCTYCGINKYIPSDLHAPYRTASQTLSSLVVFTCVRYILILKYSTHWRVLAVVIRKVHRL